MSTFETLKAEMEAGIKSVLDGTVEEFTGKCMTPSMAEDCLEELGFEKGEFDTNGWQYDWWLPFTKDGKSYTASGDGYYGQFRFSETEE